MNKMTEKLARHIDAANQERVKPLPFRYQFAAGAAAGISEVGDMSKVGMQVDFD